MKKEMDRLELTIDYWTDFVGTFDPWKVLGLIKQAFPQMTSDNVDFQQERFQREVAHWRETEMPEEQRQELIRSSTRNCRDNGPSYEFEIPFEGFKIEGVSRRYVVSFLLPKNTPTQIRDSVVKFLRSISLGAPMLNIDDPESNE